jgi:hypothetical protein
MYWKGLWYQPVPILVKKKKQEMQLFEGKEKKEKKMRRE